MNNYKKIEENLNVYIEAMNNLDYNTEKKVVQASLGDLLNIAKRFNEKSNIKIVSIKASETSLIAFGITTSFLLNACKQRDRDDILQVYRQEIERLFGRFSKDKKYINIDFINQKVKQEGNIAMEYPEPITNIILNTAAILAARVMVGQYISDLKEGTKFIEKYLVENYFNKQTSKELKHIAVK